jgi:uncharacterized protein (TIGR02246 family)
MPSRPASRFVPALVACAVAALAASLPRPALADDRADVDAATAAWIDAFNRKDAAAITALYAPDAVFFGTSSPVLRDSPALVADYFKGIASLGGSVIRLGDHRVQVYGTTAVSTGFYTRVERREGRSVESPARFSFVYAKREGSWRIVNHHSSALP